MAKNTRNTSRRVQAPNTPANRATRSRGYAKRFNRRLFWTRVVGVLIILGLLLTLFGALLGPSF